MLIDEYLPQYDAVERHATVVRASAARVYAALRTANLAASPLVRLLLAIRTLPAVLRDGGSGGQHLRTRIATSLTSRAFEAQGFVVLAEAPPQELLIGLVGTFWVLRGGMQPVDAHTFYGPQPPGTARPSGTSLSRRGPTVAIVSQPQHGCSVRMRRVAVAIGTIGG
jgi:hypothetical protein